MNYKHKLAQTCVALSLAFPVASFAAGLNNWVDASGAPARSADGQCVRDAAWTPETAVTGCVAVPAPAPVVVAPKPAPARVAVAPAPVVVAKPMPAPVAAPIKVSFSADAFFAFDKAVLQPAGKQSLDELVAKLKKVAVAHIAITGHTDAVGTTKYNQKLSERRADAVKGYLVAHGLNAATISTVGKGKSEPVASNKTKEGRAKNRRVDIELSGTSGS